MNTSVYTRYCVPTISYVPGFGSLDWDPALDAIALVNRIEMIDFDSTLSSMESPL